MPDSEQESGLGWSFTPSPIEIQQAANHLLTDPNFKLVIQYTRQQLAEIWASTEPQEAEFRELLYHRQMAIEQLLDTLRNAEEERRALLKREEQRIEREQRRRASDDSI